MVHGNFSLAIWDSSFCILFYLFYLGSTCPHNSTTEIWSCKFSTGCFHFQGVGKPSNYNSQSATWWIQFAMWTKMLEQKMELWQATQNKKREAVSSFVVENFRSELKDLKIWGKKTNPINKATLARSPMKRNVTIEIIRTKSIGSGARGDQITFVGPTKSRKQPLRWLSELPIKIAR